MTANRGNSNPKNTKQQLGGGQVFYSSQKNLSYRCSDTVEWLGEWRTKSAERNGIVVYAPGHLGDFLQMTPMLKKLREWAAGKRVTWLVGAWSLDLARRYRDWVDDIREFSPQKETLIRGNAKWKRSAIRQWLDLRCIRKSRIDVFISTMPEDPITRFVANTLRPRLWIGIGDRRPPRVRSDIQVVMVPFEKDCPEAASQMKLLDIVRCEGRVSGDDGIGKHHDLVFPVTNAEREWGQHFLATEGISGRPFAIISPGSGWTGKNWPPERFSELARWLRPRGMEVAWTGSLGEQVLYRGPGRNWMGKLALGQLAALMERAAVWIGNDSGPMHLAVAMGCKTVSFWGPTSEGKWGGQGPLHVTIRGMPSCLGCIYWDWKKPCMKNGHPCMNSISVAMAKVGVKQVLGWI